MHFSQTTSFSCILGRAVKSTARVQLGLNHDYKPETLQQKHLQCREKGVYPITKYYTFFPRPIFDTKTIKKYQTFFLRPIFDTEMIENHQQ